MKTKEFCLLVNILIIQGIFLGCSVNTDLEKAKESIPVEQNEANCSLCHGFPPIPPHVPKTDCDSCHEAVVTEDGKFYINASSHMNGQLDVLVLNCNSCHGNGASNAPPVALNSETSTTYIGVGAHQEHLNAHNLRDPIACTECHLVPTTVQQEGHIDHTITPEITWGPLATSLGANPAWNRSSATCSSTYCHGGGLLPNARGTNSTPTWTTVDQSQVTCSSCHGYPPSIQPHYGSMGSNNLCYNCHMDSGSARSTIQNQPQIDHSTGLHMDGALQLYGARYMINTTGSATIAAGSCQKYNASFTDIYGKPSNSTSAHPIQLTNPGNGAYYSDSSCSTVITDKTLTVGISSYDFYYKNNSVETVNLIIDHYDVSSSTSRRKISVAVINSPPTKLKIIGNLNQFPGLCSQPIYIESTDNFENPSVVSSDKSISLSLDAGLSLYTDSSCTSATFTSIQLWSGTSKTSSFYFKYIASGRPQAIASTTGLNSSTINFNIPTYMKMFNQDGWDLAGQTVAISGNIAVVGAPNEKSKGSAFPLDDSMTYAGAAYIFKDPNGDGDWSDAVMQAYIKASIPTPWDNFGSSVAISGSTIVVGSPKDDNTPASNSGSVYVFVDPNKDGDWTDVIEQKILIASNKDSSDYFGSAIDISGSSIIVGAYNEDSSSITTPSNNSYSGAGAAYIFSDPNGDGNWTDAIEQAYLKASNPGIGDIFGFRVAISGSTVVVGAINEDSSNESNPSDNSASNSGAAYVFVDPNKDGNWNDAVQQAYLKSPSPGIDFNFGSDVDIDGSTIVIGSQGYSYQILGHSFITGAAYIFSDPNGDGNWTDVTMQKELIASDDLRCDWFGKSVGISGSTIIVGGKLCYYGGNSEVTGKGAVYVYSDINSDGNWADAVETSIIKAPNPDINDLFGDSLDISGNNIIIGSPKESSDGSTPSNNDSDSSGAIYLLSN